MKIVINSNSNYKKAITKLLESLISIDFIDFDNVVIVISESIIDTLPEKTKIKEISDIDSEIEVVTIRMRMNNFDYTGYHALFLNMNHELVKSNSYLYLLDTVTFETQFIEIYNNLEIGNNQLLITPSPHSNICVFGKGVVENYQDNFKDILQTKDEAIGLEFKRINTKTNMKSIDHFADVIYAPERIECEKYDLYNLGHARTRFYYSHLGINKWILWDFHGDFHGEIKLN